MIDKFTRIFITVCILAIIPILLLGQGAPNNATYNNTGIFITASQISTGADTNLVDITGTTFTADAAGIYTIQIYGAINNAANTTGYGIGIDCAQTPVLIWMTGTSQLADTGTVSSWESIADNAIVGVTSGVPTNATDTPVTGGGMLKAHATVAGTCIFRLRSETTAVARLQSGSVFIVRKIS